jgi:hypothetical protein
MNFYSWGVFPHDKMYSLHFKIKVTFGHKLRYEIKVTFGEISIKLRQMNWNAARNDVNVLVDKLPSQITNYICLTIIFGLGVIRPKWRVSSEIGAKKFRLYSGHP